MVKLKVDPNVGGVGYGGKEYPIVNGFVTVPEKVAQDLLSFGWGFTLSAASAPALKKVQPDMQPPREAGRSTGLMPRNICRLQVWQRRPRLEPGPVAFQKVI